MINKRLICHHRKRRIPDHFSWIDHRFVRNGYCRKCSVEASGFYLFLLTVSDSDGLSYYGDKSISREINCTEEMIPALRKELLSAGLVAFSNKIYQVLELADTEKKEDSVREELKGTHSMNDILKNMFGGEGND